MAGTYDYPPHFDSATREILQECAAICLRVWPRSVDTTLSTGTWREQWPRARETTSSSISGRHFGHYIAGSKSHAISQMHALKTTLCLKLGLALEQWTNGLSVILEKMFGYSLVEKLRAVLLSCPAVAVNGSANVNSNSTSAKKNRF